MLNIAIEAAERAGDVLTRYWRRLDPSEVGTKALNDFVSRADKESESAIVDFLSARFPAHRILGEEGGAQGSPRLDAEFRWIIDPLDGTNNYIQGFPQFCVSIALEQAGKLRLGVIWDPLKRDLFFAEAGCGAWWNHKRIHVAQRPGLDGAFMATGFPFRAHALVDPYLKFFRTVFLRSKAVRRAGSAALDLAYTACGIFDGFFEFRLSPWDVAAGALLIQEAGGIVSPTSAVRPLGWSIFGVGRLVTHLFC